MKGLPSAAMLGLKLRLSVAVGVPDGVACHNVGLGGVINEEQIQVWTQN